METQIIYGSQYGAAKRYAHRMAERTGIPMIPYDKAEDLTGCSTIIYIGGLYAGGVLGLARTMRNPNFKPKRWFLITVGSIRPAGRGDETGDTRTAAETDSTGVVFQGTDFSSARSLGL